MTVITRFAPSPTGYLHVGGARTALFSYLFARRHNGKFVLRIEDTDSERSTEESVQAIFDGMDWLGLQHDGDVMFQSQNLSRYQEMIQKLLDNGQAYYCNCSKEELQALREQQLAAGEKPRYDGRSRDLNLSKGEDTVVRFKTPLEGEVQFHDHIRGSITVQNQELDDLVIARADGMPTYNFSVVIDDADMGITHVIRGDDHINNTPRQINIYKALGLPVPEFGHVPMILGDDGARLSKRHGAVSVMQYAQDGYLPEAVLNYLVRLGWSHGDQELFSHDEMVKLFDLSGVNKAPSSFNTSKLDWINQQYIQQAELGRLASLLQQRLDHLEVKVDESINLESVVALLRERAHTINELADMAMFLLQPLDGYDPDSDKKAFKETAIDALTALHQHVEKVTDWENADLHQLVADVVTELEVGFGKVGMPLRVALTGKAQGPANDEIMRILGQQESLNRIDAALQFVKNKFAA